MVFMLRQRYITGQIDSRKVELTCNVPLADMSASHLPDFLPRLSKLVLVGLVFQDVD
jgi:hypothetical protein